jgi:hypothetical protein
VRRCGVGGEAIGGKAGTGEGIAGAVVVRTSGRVLVGLRRRVLRCLMV